MQGSEDLQKTWNQRYSALYPINALRNLALHQASTELVFLLDVDFVPSSGLSNAVQVCIVDRYLYTDLEVDVWKEAIQ